MSSTWLLWIVLASLTQNPLLAVVVLIALLWGTDRLALGILPSPLRTFARWRRTQRLRQDLAMNPHDRRASLELAMLRLDAGAGEEVVKLLKPNLEAGDDDPVTLFTMAVACGRAGKLPPAETFFNEVRSRDPSFRMGAVDLELGRARLKNGEAAKAIPALEALVRARPGTVEGRVLLAQATASADNDKDAAKRWNDAAWETYRTSPWYVRRQQRLWAWRARPMRPVIYLTVVVVALLLVGRVAGMALEQNAHAPEAWYDG